QWPAHPQREEEHGSEGAVGEIIRASQEIYGGIDRSRKGAWRRRRVHVVELIARRRLACLVPIALSGRAAIPWHHASTRRFRRRPVATSPALSGLSAKAAPRLSFERHTTRHLCRRLCGVMRSMNSSATSSISMPVILAPPLEKLLTMQARAKRPSQSYIL